jgi:hypothetical protein
MTDQNTGAAEQPAASIRDSIDAAFAEVEGTGTPEASATEAPAVEQDGTPSEGRARDASGRFVKQDGTPEGAADAASATPESAAPAEGEQAAPEQGAAATEAPQHWSQADKDWIASLPPDHRAKAVERFKAIEAGFTPKLQRAAALEKDYGEVDRMFEPDMPALQAQGWTKGALIKAWGEVERGLATDPAGQVLKIVQHYKINTQDLAKRLGITPAAAAQVVDAAQGATPEQPAEPIHPIVKQLQDELAAVKGTLTGFTEAQRAEQQRQQQAQQTRTLSEIQAFAEAKGEDGAPSHPHFNDVMADMLALAAAERSAGRTPNLAKLYDTAVWANPDTRAKQLAADRAAEQHKAAVAAKAKSAAAQKVGSSVSGAPSSGAQALKPGSKGSIRDDIMAAFDEAS